MTNDLFLKPPTKKQQIYNFIQQKKWARTSEVIKFGLSIFTNRGDRYARELAQENKIMRMPDDKKNFYFNHIKEDVWMPVNSEGREKINA